jgi:hypothetical protein
LEGDLLCGYRTGEEIEKEEEDGHSQKLNGSLTKYIS